MNAPESVLREFIAHVHATAGASAEQVAAAYVALDEFKRQENEKGEIRALVQKISRVDGCLVWTEDA